MKALRIVTAFVLVAAVFTFTSCEGFMDFLLSLLGDSGLSMTERVEAFFETLNTDPDFRGETELADHFHGDALAKEAIANDIVSETSPLRYANATFEYAYDSVDGDVVTYTFENTWSATGKIAFTMQLEDPDGDNYQITTLTITLDADPGNPTTYRIRVPA